MSPRDAAYRVDAIVRSQVAPTYPAWHDYPTGRRMGSTYPPIAFLFQLAYPRSARLHERVMDMYAMGMRFFFHSMTHEKIRRIAFMAG